MAARRNRRVSSRYLSFACSQQGAGHLLSGTVCQDCSAALSEDDYVFISVCDGHGGADYVRSDRGSGFAVHAALDCISDRTLLDALSSSISQHETDRIIIQLKRSIVGRWIKLTEDDVIAQPFTDNELECASAVAREDYIGGSIAAAYGTTMLFAVICRGFWLAMQLGDGTCAVMDANGVFSQPLPPDERCYMNITTSMCDSDAVNEIRHIFSRDVPAAVFLSTDGVENSFSGNAGLYSFYSAIYKAFSDDDIDSAKSQLLEYLPMLTEKGSGDDVSVAFSIDTDAGIYLGSAAGKEKQNESGD